MTRCRRSYLNEDRTYKNMKRARDKYLKPKGYSDDECKEANDFLKRTIPNVKNLECHFIEGVTRMYADGELDNSDIRDKLDQVLGYLTTTDVWNEFGNTPEGRNLNGMTAQQLIDAFRGKIKSAGDADKENLSKQDFGGNNGYDIVLIDSFDKAKEYSSYTTWCVTQKEEAYNNYTKGGTFYFCLKSGFENVERVAGTNTPLDEYGLSMIAVSIYPDGKCNTITCRWNHDNGGNDKVMTTEELSKVIGENFYDAFQPVKRTLTLGGMEYVIGVTEDGSSALYDEQGNNVLGDDVKGFTKLFGCDVLEVKTSFGINFLKFQDGKVKFLFDKWVEWSVYDRCLSEQLGIPCVKITNGMRENYVMFKEGEIEYLFNEWHQGCFYADELSKRLEVPCFKVVNNDKVNYAIYQEGKTDYLFNEWYDGCWYCKNLSRQLGAPCFDVKSGDDANTIMYQNGEMRYLFNDWVDFYDLEVTQDKYLKQLEQRNENRVERISRLITEVVLKKIR